MVGNFDFFISSFNITCKPMGNSTENLNLGKSLPAPLAIIVIEALSEHDVFLC